MQQNFQNKIRRENEMKYTAPEYKNELLETKDILTFSNGFKVEEGVTENGDPKVVVTGQLSHLLGNI